MRLAAGLLSDQKYQKYRCQIKSIESIALRSKVSKAEDYELNLFFLDEEEATAADTGALKTFLHIDLQSLGDKCATNHHHRQWQTPKVPNSKTSNSSSSGSRRAREEPKKGKSSKYNFQDDGHLSSGPAVHV